jgi:DNA-binding HxlR family transcriptional regulator
VVTRRVFAEVPPRVEYSLSDLGDTLRPVLDTIAAWGTRHQPAIVVVWAEQA